MTLHRIATIIGLAAACAACLLVPAGAAAKPGYIVRPGSIAVEAVLPRDNGFSLEAFSLGRKRVDLVARRGVETVFYSAPGHASSRRLSANFGRFGRIDLRFHPYRSGVKSRPGGRCHGRDPIEQSGSYSGTIRFHDRGVASVTADRAFGLFKRSFRAVCGKKKHRHRHPHGKLQIEISLLSARAQVGNRVVAFEVASLGLGGKNRPGLTFIGAGLREDFGRVLVYRSTTELAGEGDVVFSQRGKHPERVTVSPPPPFAGRASYLENPAGPANWTGNLSVPFAGQGRVPLTGPDFHVRLCRGSSFRVLSRCTSGAAGSASDLRLSPSPRVPRPLPLRARAWRAALRSATLR